MTRWIAGITRGHNAGVCLLRDGEIIFSIEEERLSRQKYDGGPFAAMKKILDFTDKLEAQILDIQSKCNYFVPQFIVDEYIRLEVESFIKYNYLLPKMISKIIV